MYMIFCAAWIRCIDKKVSFIMTFRFPLYVATLFILLYSKAFAYTPPIGIPEPEFGITQTVLSMYGDPNYYTYYVDNTHSKATDSSNAYGSPDKPRLTIPSDFVAGDVVQIHGGPYTPSRDRFYIRGHGTETKPIFFTGAAAETKPVLTRKIHISDGQYIIVEDVNVVPTSNGAIEIRPAVDNSPIHHVSIRNSEVHGTGAFKAKHQISAHSDKDNAPVSYVVFYNNLSVDAGQYDSEPEDDSCSFSIQHRVSHAWILDNTGYDSGGDGVILAHGAKFTTHHVYIGRNTFYRHRENGIDLKQANDVVVSENTLYGFRPTNTSAGEAIIVHYDPERIAILNNHIYDSTYGIVSTGSTDTHVMGNVIHDIRHVSSSWDSNSGYSEGAAIHFRGPSTAVISDNTMSEYDTGIQITGGSKFDIYNNIFNDRKENQSYDIRVNNSTLSKATTLDNNIFNQVRIYFNGTTYDMLGFFQSSEGLCENCFESQDLRFTDASKDSYSLQGDSPAIDKGKASTTIPYFEQTYNITIDKDIGGTEYDNTSDIGAYDYPSTLSPPTAPSDVEVIVQ